MQDKTPVRAADETLAAALAGRIQAGHAEAIEVLRKFATWVPDDGYPHDLDVCTGEAADKESLRDAPFVSESYLYALLGKEDARTFLALFNSVCRALGVAEGYHDLQAPWYAQRYREAKEAAEKSRDHVNTLREKGHTLNDKHCPKCDNTPCKRQRAMYTFTKAASLLFDRYGEKL